MEWGLDLGIGHIVWIAREVLLEAALKEIGRVLVAGPPGLPLGESVPEQGDRGPGQEVLAGPVADDEHVLLRPPLPLTPLLD